MALKTPNIKLMRIIPYILLSYIIFIAVSMNAHANIHVVASIKPIHSLVASVMNGIGKPALIIDGFNSPHTYSLRPSQAVILDRADVVFWLGPPLETFLEKPIKNVATRAISIELLNLTGLRKLPIRQTRKYFNLGTGFDGHIKNHGNFIVDPHVWLDPKNAKVIVMEIVRALSQIDPVHGSIYAGNGQSTIEKLEQLSNDLSSMLKPINDQNFFTFHDSFQYFEKSFGMRSAGHLTNSPELIPGAGHTKKTIEAINVLKVVCIFDEPQFKSKFIRTIIGERQIKSSVLDPLGLNFDAGPSQYFLMMRQIANSLHKCLS